MVVVDVSETVRVTGDEVPGTMSVSTWVVVGDQTERGEDGLGWGLQGGEMRRWRGEGVRR